MHQEMLLRKCRKIVREKKSAFLGNRTAFVSRLAWHARDKKWWFLFVSACIHEQEALDTPKLKEWQKK
jgi:hypothetical protein